MNGLEQIVRNLGAARLAAMAVVGAGVIAFFIFMTQRFNQPPMAMLYQGLDLSDSGAIVGQLESMNVPYQLRGNGGEVLVPSDQVLKLRMTIAQVGLPAGGSTGYEIFDRTESLGTTSFVQNINLLRALEGEIARSIRTIDRIENARVHLVLPKREVFARQHLEPSASIVLKLRGNVGLDRGQVAAIQNLVAAAVPRLQPNRISIVDARGNLLVRSMDGEDSIAAMPTSIDEARAAYERRIKNSIEALLGQTIGQGKVRAQVSAEIDFDRITTNSETYDPDGQVVRSTQVVEESDRSSESDPSSAVSVSENLPEAQADSGGEASASSTRSRTEETTNYEISKTIKTEIREAGTIRRLSVAVLIDGIYRENDAGELVYQPRSEAELQALSALVRSAIGFDEQRGDKVDVINLQFVKVEQSFEELEPDSTFFGLAKEDIFKIAETLVLGVVAILVLLLVVRPLLGRLLSASKAPLAAPTAALPGAPNMAQLPHAAGTPAIAPPLSEDGQLPAPAHGARPTAEQMIDLGKIEGDVKASTLKKVGEIVENHPEEAVAIVRNWLYQDA